MELFSQKYGHKPARNVIQVDRIDTELRNSLWNALDDYYWKESWRRYKKLYEPEMDDIRLLFHRLWKDYIKLPLDTMPPNWGGAYKQVRDYFFSCKWFEVYDIVQFIANEYYNPTENENFMKDCNTVLEREMSAYRFVGNRIAMITSKEEITEIDEAIASEDLAGIVAIHLQTALDKLSDRQSPDYRNSIKESISAVEAMCKLITKKKKATLPQALKVIAGKVNIHPALLDSFNKLYAYTSDAEGIRHSLMEESTLCFEDAKFMLVSCCAFVNYLRLKASQAGIELAT